MGEGGEEEEIGLEPLPSLRKSQKVGPVRKTLVVFMPPSCFSLNIIKTTYMICQVAQTIRLQNSSYMVGDYIIIVFIVVIVLVYYRNYHNLIS